MFRGYLLLLICLTLIAFAANSVLCRLALREGSIDAASFTAIRIASGAAILLLIVRGRRAVNNTSWISASMLFAYAACFSYAYLRLSAGTGALLLFGAVQVTMFAFGLAQGDRPQVAEWLGWVVAFAGMIYLVLPGISAPEPFGALLMCCAGVAWGVYSVRGRNATDPIVSTAQNFVLATPMALILHFSANGFTSSGDSRGIVLALISGAITSALGYVLWYSVLPQLSTFTAAVSQLTVPILAAAGGVLFLSEDTSARLAVSALLTMGGAAAAYQSRRAKT